MKKTFVPGSAVICALLAAVLAASALESPAPAGAANDTAAAVTAGTDADRARERSIYVPYKKLRQVFEKEGRGVFLPYEEFLDLWQAALAEDPTPKPEPPVGALITEVSGVATVSNDVLMVKAHIRVEALKDGWHEVPLRLADTAITKATLGKDPARIIIDRDQGYKLLVEKRGEDPAELELVLEFAKAYTKAPGRNTVSFQSPLAPLSRWEVRIPEPGVKVDIRPALAATEVPAEADADETRILAFVGATPTVRIEWTPKAEGAKGLAALASVQAEHRVWIDEGVTRNRVELNYEISRAELAQLTVEIPQDQKVVNVFDPNVREWSVAADAALQRVTVQLFEPAKDAQKLVVELEKFDAAGQVTVPVVRAVGVGRQQGTVVVKVSTGLRAETTVRDGLLQLDADELPDKLRKGGWDFSYRYAALPYSLTVTLEKVQPRILAESLTEIHLQPEELTVDFVTVHDIQRAGVFNLAFLIPGDLEIREVTGVEVAGAKAVGVDSHHLRDGRLVVNLSRKAQGRVGLSLRLQRALREPALLSPTGAAARIAVGIPRADRDAVERESGRLVVYGPESLRVNPDETVGLRAIAAKEAVENMRSTQDPSVERAALAFAYGHEPVTFSVAAERRKPHVAVRQLLVARIESGVVKYEATLFTDILYSGVKALRLDVPEPLASHIRVITAGVRRSPVEAAGELQDLAEGYVPWSLAGETEFTGSSRVLLAWERKIDELDTGKSVELDIPRLIPRGVDRAWGQIVLTKAESIDVVPTDRRDGLRPIDPQHDLMPRAKVDGASHAFEFHGDWQLTIKATRYEPKDVKATSIERALVRLVVTRGRLTSVQAVYQMRSARQRLVIHLPENVEFDTQPLRIDGRPVALEQGSQGEFFVPLVGQNQETAFLLELRYVVRDAGLRLECPSFPNEPATQKVYLEAFLPKELVLLGWRGPWNDEILWTLNGLSARPSANRSSSSLIGWVTKGLKVERGALESFATDGRQLLFSTLRPLPGPEGSLRLAAVKDPLFHVLLVALVVVLGLSLVRAGFGKRAVVVGSVLAALALLAVFLPTLTRAVVSNATAAAVFVVLVIWTLRYLLVTRPRDPVVKARKRARRERKLAAARDRERRPEPRRSSRRTASADAPDTRDQSDADTDEQQPQAPKRRSRRRPRKRATDETEDRHQGGEDHA